MKKLLRFAVSGLAALTLFWAVSCSAITQKPHEDYLDAGNSNLTVSGFDFDPSTQFRHQFTLYRFDTSASNRTLTLPSAASIISNLAQPYIGELIVFAVSADGSNPVTVEGAENVTVKPSARTVPGNTTATLYCELKNVTRGSEAVTIY